MMNIQSENKKQTKSQIANSNPCPFEIDFTNFGSIIKGKLVLKKLTVIHGPNGSGKSYSASFIYNILNLLNKSIRTFNVSSEEINYVQEWIKSLPYDQENEISDSFHNYLVNFFFKNFIKKPYDLFYESFGCEPLKLVNFKKDSFRILLKLYNYELKFTLDRINHPNTVDFEILNFPKLNIKIIKKQAIKPKTKKVTDYICSDPVCTTGLITIDDNVSYQKLCEIFNSNYYELFQSLKITPSLFYLPASRTGIIQFRNYIIETMYKSIGSQKENLQSIPMQINRDFLYDLYQGFPRKNPEDKNDHLEDLLVELEKRVLKGNINRIENKTRNIIDYSIQIDKLELDLIQASSLITEIAPVIIYLRYHVKKGDYLFIEEPEAHLNLENQWLFAKLMVRCIREGINIVLITHSHYFISRLNNFILASQLSEKDRKSVQLEKDFLNPEEVIINEFKPMNKEETNQFFIDNIDAKKDGIDFESFNAVLDEIGKEYHRIMDLLDKKY